MNFHEKREHKFYIKITIHILIINQNSTRNDLQYNYDGPARSDYPSSFGSARQSSVRPFEVYRLLFKIQVHLKKIFKYSKTHYYIRHLHTEHVE